MRRFALIAATVALAACSGVDSKEAAGPAAAEGGGDYRALAQCSAYMDAVSALYSAIADATSADKAGEMRSTAELRTAAAQVLKAEAEKVAGDASGEVPTIISETKASIDSQKDAMPFQDFGALLGKQADGCAPMVQEIVKRQ